MDIVSHAIIGRMFVSSKKHARGDIFLIPFFAALPDFFQIPLYLFLGYINHRPFFWPQNSDWIGFRSAYPEWVLWWDIPHSLFFLLLIVIPVVLKLNLNRLAILAYFSHLFVDWFTHTGEWGVKPLFPLPFMIDGFTDAWAWDAIYYPMSWAVLVAVVVLIEKLRSSKR